MPESIRQSSRPGIGGNRLPPTMKSAGAAPGLSVAMQRQSEPRSTDACATSPGLLSHSAARGLASPRRASHMSAAFQISRGGGV